MIAAAQNLVPKSEAELSDIIQSGGPFAIRGGGAKDPADLQGTSLWTTGLDGIVNFEPNAQTLVARAGTTLSEVVGVLAAHKQRLAFEVPQTQGLLKTTEESTIGGIAAANASGPRRIAVGACRDACLGVRFVDGRGRILKSGGRVMKNVTGYDLVKLMVGSQGRLGVLTEVALKTQPIPASETMLVLDGLDDKAAVACMSAAMGTPYEVTGAGHLPATADTPAHSYLRLEGFADVIAIRAQKLAAALAEFAPATIVSDPAVVQETFRGIRDATRFIGAEGDIWRVSLPPSHAAAFVNNVDPRDAYYDWGGGLVWLLCKPGTDVRAHLVSGHATIVRAAPQTVAKFGALHPDPPALAKITAGLRNVFDPDNKFNQEVTA